MRTYLLLKGLDPIIGKHPRVLILGSMPSVSSMQKQQYYGHPRNAFWPLIAELLAFPLEQKYAANVAAIEQRGVAVWDVISECEREGSLDSSIVKGSERINLIPELITRFPDIVRIGLNGGAAARLFKRHCLPQLHDYPLETYYLPSTSPANAGMNFNEKCAAWKPLFSLFNGVDVQ